MQIVLTLVTCVRCWALASPMPTRRVALVTGSNKGIGKEIARRLAAEGLTTILGCRSAELGEAAADELRGGELRGGGGGGDDGGDDGMDVVFQRIDLTDPKSVDDVREFIAQNYGRLDVLINNAAICFNDPTLYGKCAHTPFERQADITVTTNFFGTLGVTRALLPLLRAAPSPRVINIASAAGRLSILRSQEKAAAFSSPAVEIDEIAGLMTEFVADVESGVHAEKVKERGSKWGRERRKNGGRTVEDGNGLIAVLTPPPLCCSPSGVCTHAAHAAPPPPAAGVGEHVLWDVKARDHRNDPRARARRAGGPREQRRSRLLRDRPERQPRHAERGAGSADPRRPRLAPSAILLLARLLRVPKRSPLFLRRVRDRLASQLDSPRQRAQFKNTSPAIINDGDGVMVMMMNF